MRLGLGQAFETESAFSPVPPIRLVQHHYSGKQTGFLSVGHPVFSFCPLCGLFVYIKRYAESGRPKSMAEKALFYPPPYGINRDMVELRKQHPVS